MFIYSISKSGSLLWKQLVGGKTTSPALTSNDVVYFGSATSPVVDGYNATNGKLIFHLTDIEGIVKSGPVIGLNGSLYFSTSSFVLYSISYIRALPPSDDWTTYVFGNLGLIIGASLASICFCCVCFLRLRCNM